MNNHGLHIGSFNDKVKVMNQLGKKDLLLTAVEARNLHADIFALLNTINELAAQLQRKSDEGTIEVHMDGGGF